MKSSKSTLNIRPAKIEDQQYVKSLLLTFKLPLDGLENTEMWVLLENNGKVIGTAGLEIWGKQGLLRSVAVNKNMHNRGYGTSLVKYVIEDAKKSGLDELFLLTTTASAFFQKLGFKEYDRIHVIGSITESAEFKSACPKTAVLMRLNLK